MGIVEYVTLIKAISVNGIEMQLTEKCIQAALSLIPYQFFRVPCKSQCMSNAQKVGHAQPLFTNVHAIDSFLAFPFMGIVEYVT